MRTWFRPARSRRWLLVLLLAGVALFQMVQSRTRVESHAEAGAPAETVVPTGESHGGTRGFGPRVGFRSEQRLAEHFRKHGAEFRAEDEAAYLAVAQALRDAPAGGPVIEAVRSDGVITRFDRRDGTFIAFDRDGTLRTCFRPNDGLRYFERQARRGGATP